MAMHDRDWNIKTYTDLDELCREACRDITWTLCTGFRWQNVTLLNDSFSEDSIAEFALVIDIVVDGEQAKSGTQLDSITVSWCKPVRLAEIIRETLADLANRADRGQTYGVVEFGQHDGECYLCR